MVAEGERGNFLKMSLLTGYLCSSDDPTPIHALEVLRRFSGFQKENRKLGNKSDREGMKVVGEKEVRE